MGLCKCPKKKVTNLFCFKHRVNVCEHCLVSNHNKCIVQSYLQWLQDSDYNPNCSLCIQPLDSQDTVRLVCYDLFHWSCLNELASHQPLNTAPDGYQCPTCQGPVFPPRNLASPVADMLREQLSSVNWARAGLGLPLIEDPQEEETTTHSGSSYSEWSTFETTSVDITMSNPTLTSLPPHQDVEHIYNNREQSAPNNTVFNMTTTSATDSITINTVTSPRKLYDTRDLGHSAVMQIDFDDDKYRRRPALSWFAQVLKNCTSSKKKTLALKHRIFLLLLVGVIGFFTLIIIMAKLGRASAETDPNLDPLLNPNIRIGNM
ncbi:zinc finger protein-like 1 [Danio aesculapii]|uniref:zinc finger protein-like 1 n=1 Tax=Danio aesculapii TaxID=1142201 RepID=UPI0024BF9980|nr:zinc finger protein-like 1 [Danio aesculapii]XP_056314504.1 zinc finger protein-like 1 [Danio aesculapii]